MESGILASTGIAIGKAFLIKKKQIILKKKYISINKIEKEIKKFLKGIKKTIYQLKKIKKKTRKKFGKKEEKIFDSHVMILEDEEFQKEIICLIKKKKYSSEVAVQKIIKKQIKKIEKINDEYLKNRATDIKDIGDRILRNILNLNCIQLKKITHKVILIAKDLSPSETAQINFKKVLGFITDLGGKTSHTSIMARSLEIPAIVGTIDITKKISNEDMLILDGINNNIIINPTAKEIKNFKKIKKIYLLKKKKLLKEKNLSATTKDGHKIMIGANIGNIHDIKNVKKYGGECIGLYRTEFLFMKRDNFPTEEEQFNAYKKIAKKMHNKPVIIRTLDIGGDKKLPYMHLPKEDNPFLGWRAIRISIDKKEILQTQLRAILRASVFGKLRIMFPMIISMEEIHILKKELYIAKNSLSKKTILFDKKIKIGIMIETPAAVILSKHLIQEIDFFSIGTNDLTQYTLAVDRGNDLIANLYNPMSPSVLKSIKKVIKASHKNKKWTGICGELASDPKATILLIGMGLDEFSMSPISIPYIKRIIREINFSDAKKLAKKALSKPTSKEITNLIELFIKKNRITV